MSKASSNRIHTMCYSAWCVNTAFEHFKILFIELELILFLRVTPYPVLNTEFEC